MIGKQLLHYRISGKLGEGGMGVVFKAEDTRLKRDVAVKFLPRRDAATPDERRRFETEARAAAALNHPNIAHVYAIEESDGELFIVMELVKGHELRELVGGLSREQSVEIALQIAAALKLAHDRGIVHRDIKCANIMVTDEGQAKIMDFGLAKISGNTRVTQSGMTVGTIDYMSPEQLRGEDVDQRSDIWSFGVVLYEMFTGQRPFQGNYPEAIMYAITNQDVPSPATLAPDLPSAVVELVRRMLIRDRSERCPGMADVITTLTSLKQVSTSEKSSARQRRQTDKAKGLPGVAVLPFASIRVDPDTEFLGFALADQIIGALAYVDSIAVRPSSAVRKYQGQPVDVATTGRELHADFVLAGHYLKEADTVRLNVELIEAQSSDLVWRDSIEVKYENAFKLQDIVSKKVLRGLKVQFPKNAKSGIDADAPASPLAYEYYLRSISYSTTLDDNRLAIEMLNKSIKLDPVFAPAHAELGYRLSQQANYGTVGGDGWDEAEVAFRKALSLNDKQLSALTHLTLRCIEFGRHEEAVDLIRRQLQLTPNGAWPHFLLSYICRYTGMMERSIAEVEMALKLDPRNPRFRSAGFTYMYAGDYQRAYELFKSLDERSAPPVAWQGWALALMGERERAIECFDRAAAMEPDGFVALRFGCIGAFIKGDVEDGMRLIRRMNEELNQRSRNDAEVWYLMATSCSLLGDRMSSIRGLRQAVDSGFFNYPAMLRDPYLDPLRADPEFQQVIALAKEKHEAFKATFSTKI